MPTTKTKVIDGSEFTVTCPYEAGQTIGEAEAKALNQTRAENIGNNTRVKIKEMKAEGKSEAEIQEYVAGVDAEYELTVSAVSSARKLDPVEKEAQRIAREFLKTKLAETGRKLTVAPDGETDESWKEKVQGQIDILMEHEEILKLAKENIKNKQKQADKLEEALQI